MKRMKLLLTAMLVVAIVALSVSCPNESTGSVLEPLEPLEPLETVAVPVIIIGEGQDANSYDFSKPITFASSTEGVTFHYTTNGITIPTTESLSGASLTLPTDANKTYTVKVIGVKEGFTNSDVTGKTFTKGTVATPIITGGDFVLIDKEDNNVSFSVDTVAGTLADTIIYYTRTGGTPTASSTMYTAPFIITETEIVKAIAVKAGLVDSDIASAEFKKVSHVATRFVGAGSFDAGDPGGSSTHNVTLTNGFYMGTTEVTQGQWKKVMDSAWPGADPNDPNGFGDNHPAYNISWYDAVKFCNALSIIEGLTSYYDINEVNQDPNNISGYDTLKWLVTASTAVGADKGYRLPTEAEWEYAARGGQHTESHGLEYAGSDTIGSVAWYGGSSGSSGSKTVGTKEKNALGLYDMSGNVWEWCWDWYSGTYPSSATDPTGAAEGSRRVNRGGNSGNTATYCRVANRSYYSPSLRPRSIGFRVVRS